MDSTARRLLFPFSAPPATPARPRGGASPEGGRVGSRCMQRHCRWRRCCRLRCCRIRDSVAVSCIAACCASLPAEHCRPAAAHCSCASFVLCHHAASIVPAAAAVTHSLLEVRLLGKPGQPDCVGPRVSAVPVASPSALLRLQLSAARLIAACALLLAHQRAPQNTYSSQHSLLARGSIPRQVESNTKVTALCTARISICAVCALATGPLRRLGECKAHSTAPLSSLVSASHAMPCTSR